MRKRNSDAKPAARTWLVQMVMASSSVSCQSPGSVPVWPAGPATGCSKATILANMSSSSASSHCASKPSDNTSENSSAASTVSGVVGSSFKRMRSANSLMKALRDEKP